MSCSGFSSLAEKCFQIAIQIQKIRHNKAECNQFKYELHKNLHHNCHTYSVGINTTFPLLLYKLHYIYICTIKIYNPIFRYRNTIFAHVLNANHRQALWLKAHRAEETFDQAHTCNYGNVISLTQTVCEASLGRSGWYLEEIQKH